MNIMENNGKEKTDDVEKISLRRKEKIEYLSLNFKELRKDINIRVNAHTQFVMQKIVTVLGGLTLLFGSKVLVLCYGHDEKDDISKILVLLVFPVVAGIYDIMIA